MAASVRVEPAEVPYGTEYTITVDGFTGSSSWVAVEQKVGKDVIPGAFITVDEAGHGSKTFVANYTSQGKESRGPGHVNAYDPDQRARGSFSVV